MTFNKSQSQTLDRVLIDSTGEPFAHGHAYVAFSRVRNCKNIVYQEVIQFIYCKLL